MGRASLPGAAPHQLGAEQEEVAHSSFLANTPLSFHSILISHPASKGKALFYEVYQVAVYFCCCSEKHSSFRIR